MGTGRRLRAFRHDIRLVSVQPESPLNGIEGLKHMETAIRPGIYDDALADEDIRVSTERAYALTRRLATEEGLLVGVSSGAALAATLDLAARIREGVIVTIFPDSGTTLPVEGFWEATRRRPMSLRETLTPRLGRVALDDSAEAIETIRRHGAETFPDECCGALIAVDGRIVEAFEMDNTTDIGAARRFRIGPDGYRQAERARAGARGRARRLLPFAPQRTRAAIGVRSRARLAESHVCHHFCPGRHAG